MEYSISKGFKKGVTSALVSLAAIVAFAGFSDLSVWGLVETYVKPLVGSLTVGGAIAMVLNYMKVRNG